MTERTYIAIDLKSFYASVECVERQLDLLNTNLIVADESRTEKTIVLAVSPSLKAYGLPGRPRLFEVIQQVEKVNNQRLYQLRKINRNYSLQLGEPSHFASELYSNPSLKVDYIIAPPRMKYYIEYSTKIYEVYLKCISEEDIVVYSIDKVFMDVTNYLVMYKQTAHELAMTIIRDVLKTTSITAMAGINTKLYLAKNAMDIVAKKMPPDKDGVRIAELDEDFSIEEGDVECFLAHFFYKHFDNELIYNKRRFKDGLGFINGFEWYLTYNFFTYESVRALAEDIDSVAELLKADFDNPALTDAKKSFSIFYMCPSDDKGYIEVNSASIRKHIDVVIDFYKRFANRILKMLDNNPDTDLISIMDP